MTVFHSGDQVIYGAHGVCTIVGIDKQKVGKKLVEYYVLQPKEGAGSRFYVPTQNEAAVSKLRNVLTRDEVTELLSSDAVRQSVWIEDENLRKQRYRELITGSDKAALVSMVHCLNQHRDQQVAAGRKFHICDENFLRDTQKLLGSEFSLALDIPEHEVGEVVKKILE